MQLYINDAECDDGPNNVVINIEGRPRRLFLVRWEQSIE